jgi:hypothetical protein
VRIFTIGYLTLVAVCAIFFLDLGMRDQCGSKHEHSLVLGGGVNLTSGSGFLRETGSGVFGSEPVVHFDPPVLPEEDCSSYATAAEEWWCFYRWSMQEFEAATRSGFRAPQSVHDEGSGRLVMYGEGSAIGHVDWAHPVGFAIIDCDRHSLMLDGSGSAVAATIAWDPKGACLRVLDILPRRTR